MLNVVIFSKDLEYAIYLMNVISSTNANLKVIAIINKFEEFINVSKEIRVDIILIKDNQMDYMILERRIMKKYLKSIILISNRKIDKLEVYAIIEDKNNNINDIIEKVNELVLLRTNKENSNLDFVNRTFIINKIAEELKYLEVQNFYNGTEYLIEAIYIVYNLGEDSSYTLEHDIYPVIAAKYHKKPSNIKSNIHYAIDNLYIECREDKLLEYLDEYGLCKVKPKNLLILL